MGGFALSGVVVCGRLEAGVGEASERTAPSGCDRPASIWPCHTPQVRCGRGQALRRVRGRTRRPTAKTPTHKNTEPPLARADGVAWVARLRAPSRAIPVVSGRLPMSLVHSLPRSYLMNMCSYQRAGTAASDYSCLNTTQPRTHDPRMSEFLGLAAATSEAMKPW